MIRVTDRRNNFIKLWFSERVISKCKEVDVVHSSMSRSFPYVIKWIMSVHDKIIIQQQNYMTLIQLFFLTAEKNFNTYIINLCSFTIDLFISISIKLLNVECNNCFRTIYCSYLLICYLSRKTFHLLKKILISKLFNFL